MRLGLPQTSSTHKNSIQTWLPTSPLPIRAAIEAPRTAEGREQQSAFLMASLSSLSHLISRVTLTIPKNQRPWPNSQVRMERGEQFCAAHTDSRRISLGVISKCA